MLVAPLSWAGNKYTGRWERVERDREAIDIANQACYEDQFDDVDEAVEASFESDVDENVAGGGGKSEEELVVGGWEFEEGIAGLVWASG